jgi:hypothetical protein
VSALLAVAAFQHWSLSKMDVKNAFLNSDLSEEVYMQPPPGLSSPPNKVCRLRRALYGLRNLAPLSLALATPLARMTLPCLFAAQIEASFFCCYMLMT